MRRTDIHAPSSADFDPAKYEIVDCFDNNPEWGDNDWCQVVRNLLDGGYKFGNGSAFNCGHCGAAIRYFALLIREDVKEFICVGEQCLHNRFRDLTAAQFQDLRTTARLNRERATAGERVARLKADHACIARLLDGDDPEVDASEFLTDVRAKALATGRLTDAQIAAVGRAMAGVDRRRQWEAERKAKAAAMAAAGIRAPEGRVEIEGTIVTVKEQDGNWGPTTKVVVRTDAGWAVWLTLPAGLDAADGLRGRRLRVTATLKRSDRDAAFAFGTRPAKAAWLDSAPASEL